MDTQAEDAAPKKTPPSHRLLAAILAQVRATRDSPLTVQEIAERLDQAPTAVAACIALHSAGRGIIDPNELHVPRPDEPVDDKLLGIARPPR